MFTTIEARSATAIILAHAPAEQSQTRVEWSADRIWALALLCGAGQFGRAATALAKESGIPLSVVSSLIHNARPCSAEVARRLDATAARLGVTSADLDLVG